MIFTIPFQLLYYFAKDFYWACTNKTYITLNGVWLYTGEVGAGKTLSMVEHAVFMKRRDKDIQIWANFPCDFADKIWHDFDELYNVPSYTIILCSEAAILANAREWKSFPKGLVELLTQNRKWGSGSTRPPGIRMLIDCQDATMIDNVIRKLTNMIVYCRPYCNFGNGPRFIFQRWFRPAQYYKAEGRRKSCGIYMYVPTDKLRDGYKTYYRVTKNAGPARPALGPEGPRQCETESEGNQIKS